MQKAANSTTASLILARIQNQNNLSLLSILMKNNFTSWKGIARIVKEMIKYYNEQI